LLEIFVNDTSY